MTNIHLEILKIVCSVAMTASIVIIAVDARFKNIEYKLIVLETTVKLKLEEKRP